jgi:hypothetical protein
MSISDQIADQCETLDQARGVIRALLLSDPRAPSFSLAHDHVGLSLRDWFAGMALQALPITFGQDTAERQAEMAYIIADAMLAAREKS